MDLLAEGGFEALSFEEVARRSQASKATLYRRWSSRKDMVVAAIKSGPNSGMRAEPVDTGSLRGDLLELLERLQRSMSRGGRASLILLQAGLEDPDLCHHIEESVGPTGARLPEEVVQRAIARGELPPGAKAFAYEEVAGAVLLLRSLNGLTTDTAYRELLVDAVLIPALGSAAGEHAQHGIFSGAPTPASPSTTTDRNLS